MPQSTSSLIGDRQPIATSFRSGSQSLSGRTLLIPIAVMLAFGGCVVNKNLVGKSVGPMGEAELAAKKLQLPLDTHLCKAVVYPTSRPDWKISRVVSLQGRGANFQAALESLCREADGQRLPAVVDIYYERAVTAWSQHHAIRGTAVRYGDGFEPPPAPELGSIKPPDMPKATDEEPAPSGEAIPTK